LKMLCPDKSVHPSNLPGAQPVGLGIVLEDQNSLPMVSQGSFGERLMRLVATPNRIAATLCDIELDRVGYASCDGWLKQCAPVFALTQ